MVLKSYSIICSKNIAGVEEIVDSEELDLVAKDLSDSSGFAFEKLGNVLKTKARIPWFDFEGSLELLSSKYPSLLIRIEVNDESNNTTLFYKGGKKCPSTR